MPYGEVDRIAKLIPFELGMTLEKALVVEPQLKQLVQEDEGVAELIALARSLEGLARNVGMHAGGVLIAPGKLTDFTPLYAAEGSSAMVSQFDKDDVEKAGLVKFDFLGLTTLTILDWAVRYVHLLGNNDFRLEDIPLDDAQTYRNLSKGDATAVFQLESRGMRDLLKRLKPDRFEDVIALVALYRPGPMDLIPDFTERKHGRQRVEYADPRLQPILGPTYGIMVYQEQVMQIAQVLGGYTLGSADLLRRAMGKKKVEEMAAQRAIFKEGAARNGLSASKADVIFDLMEKFAGYGFNKSHAAAYALLAYQTGYMKTHHLAAFMAANLSAVMTDTDKVQVLHDDAKNHGLEIRPPDINASEYRFVPLDAKRIAYGLGAVKGTGEQAIESIVSARKAAGPFRDLADFCRRVDRRLVNRRAMEAFIRAGAFDSIEPNRASLLASLGQRDRGRGARRAVQAASEPLRRRRRGARGVQAHARDPVGRARASAEREAFPGLLPVGASIQCLPRRAAALRAHAAREPPALHGAGDDGGRDLRRADAQLAARAHRHPHARRRHGTGRGGRLQRALPREARRGAGGPGDRGEGAHLQRRLLRGVAHHRGPAHGPGGAARRVRAAAAPEHQRPGGLGEAEVDPRPVRRWPMPRGDPLPECDRRMRHPSPGELQGENFRAAARFARRMAR
jgi:hypothetical protein